MDLTLDQLFARLWDDYVAQNPQAAQIRAFLEARGERPVNDHIALRSFGDPRLGIDALARAFVDRGYAPAGSYEFPEKRLRARHYVHPEPGRPKVFISELELDRCSPALARRVTWLCDQIDPAALRRDDLAVAGRLWPAITADEHASLAAESEYAAWLAVFGLRANHFTILVNALESVGSLEAMNALVRGAGIALNEAGGAIKGSPALLLEQSSTLAAPVVVALADREVVLPGCYYEFARRYPDAEGRLFGGFVPGSADRIFESTDRQEARPDRRG
ncbi:MAG: DUF1338 domain-containing protein [Myxococcales bacterium]|nr:DUF1338 domain-containing protein [Myxococcales bacterium]MCB9703499.1 DUF1338 domain-containing protein [Myxococcales bacterium]